MGEKAYKWLMLFVALVLLAQPCAVHAASVSELYTLYGKTFEVDIPEDILHTISTYNNAKRYVSMFNYVVNSEYDTESIRNEIAALDAELATLESKLMSGINSNIVDLQLLEDTYVSMLKRRTNLEQSLISYTVDDSEFDPGSVPTYSEYSEAMRTKNAVMADLEIGNIDDLMVPAQSQAKLMEVRDTECVYKVIEGTGVLSLFNGTVEDVIVDDEYGLSVIVDNKNGVKTYFCNLEIADVTPGETVYQNQRLGYVYGSKLILRLELDEDFVDISKLLVEE